MTKLDPNSLCKCAPKAPTFAEKNKAPVTEKTINANCYKDFILTMCVSKSCEWPKRC